MNGPLKSGEQFRKGFVLVLTIAYAVAFLAILSGFFQALLLAAVLSGLDYPFYLWLKNKLGGRDTLASLLTITLTLFVIVVPLISLLGLIAGQAVNVAGDVKPWIELQLDSPAKQVNGLPDWIPFSDKLEPYQDQISAKIAAFTGTAGGFLAESLLPALYHALRNVLLSDRWPCHAE